MNKNKKVKLIFLVVVLVLGLCFTWLTLYKNNDSLDNVPSLEIIKEEGEDFANKKLKGYDKEKLAYIWGQPSDVISESEAVWSIDEETYLNVCYDNSGKVTSITLNKKG